MLTLLQEKVIGQFNSLFSFVVCKYFNNNLNSSNNLTATNFNNANTILDELCKHRKLGFLYSYTKT